uniref:PGG domain-containing protein n=1 Tax=Caenorhabditis tropicalis TaxID=1561998 RepID=A0A1I7U0E0_9PELO
MQQPCLSQVTTVSCKLQEFPLIFCYIHCAATCFLLAASVALSLLFTAFDQDLKNEPMNKCSILLAVSQSFLTFALLTLLILLHAFGLVFITIASVLQRNK